jgi:hypothetical protein
MKGLTVAKGLYLDGKMIFYVVIGVVVVTLLILEMELNVEIDLDGQIWFHADMFLDGQSLRTWNVEILENSVIVTDLRIGLEEERVLDVERMLCLGTV